MKVLLLLETLHGSENCFPPLSAFKIFFLPPHTTSRLQSMDVGVIWSLKKIYLTVHYNRFLDRLDDRLNEIYKIDQLTSIYEAH